MDKLKSNQNIKLSGNKPEIILRGIPSSPGMSLGKAVIINSRSVFVSSTTEPINDIPYEIQRFKSAIKKISSEINSFLEIKTFSKNIRAIIESGLLMLNDDFIHKSIINMIEKGQSAEQAVVDEFENQKQFFLNSDDALLKERIIDVEQLKSRIIKMLRNQKEIISAGKGSIFIAQYVSPEEVVKLKERDIAGIITEIGGITAHSSILSRTYEIPEVIGINDITNKAQNGDIVIVDGYSGTVKINPSQESLDHYQDWKKAEKEHKRMLGRLTNLPAETRDKKRILLKANINLPEDMDKAQMSGSDGAGLVRTEYLVLTKGHFPDEEAQYEWYKEIAEKCYPNTVTFRVFDVGSDKIAEGLPNHELNPALGFRGIRFLLQRKEIFRDQIKAILRASYNKNVRILIPMISNLAELEESLVLIDECKSELKKNGKTFDKKMPVGIMIETPAAAIISDALASKCDFFSIGTNDLTQYALAVDRTNELVASIYDSLHPAIIILIMMAVNSAIKHKIPVGICGELANHSAATAMLIGMGIDELSITPSSIPQIKKHIRDLYFSDSVLLAERIKNCTSSDELKTALRDSEKE